MNMNDTGLSVLDAVADYLKTTFASTLFETEQIEVSVLLDSLCLEAL